MAMSDTLSKPVGPLPMGAWVVVVGGGLGIAWWTRKNGTASTPTTTPATLADAVGTGASGFTNSAQVTTPAVASGPTTNDQWAALALTWAATNTNYSLTAVSNAISKYFAGEQRTVAEETILNSLFRSPVGAPPTPGPQAPYPPAPPPPVNVPPPSGDGYVGPATKKAWKTDNIAYPKVTDWQAVLLYYYDNVAPPGTGRALQMYKLIADNGGQGFHSGMKVYLPNKI